MLLKSDINASGCSLLPILLPGLLMSKLSMPKTIPETILLCCSILIDTFFCKMLTRSLCQWMFLTSPVYSFQFFLSSYTSISANAHIYQTFLTEKTYNLKESWQIKLLVSAQVVLLIIWNIRRLVRLLLLSLFVGDVVMVTASLILMQRDRLRPTSGIVVVTLSSTLLRIHFYI